MRAQGSFGYLGVARRQRPPPLVTHLARRDPSVGEWVADLIRAHSDPGGWVASCRLRGRITHSARHPLLAGARTPAIVIGNVAGVLQGAPQPPAGGWVEIMSGDP
jgi:hypothetical protein